MPPIDANLASGLEHLRDVFSMLEQSSRLLSGGAHALTGRLPERGSTQQSSITRRLIPPGLLPASHSSGAPRWPDPDAPARRASSTAFPGIASLLRQVEPTATRRPGHGAEETRATKLNRVQAMLAQLDGNLLRRRSNGSDRRPIGLPALRSSGASASARRSSAAEATARRTAEHRPGADESQRRFGAGSSRQISPAVPSSAASIPRQPVTSAANASQSRDRPQSTSRGPALDRPFLASARHRGARANPVPRRPLLSGQYGAAASGPRRRLGELHRLIDRLQSPNPVDDLSGAPDDTIRRMLRELLRLATETSATVKQLDRQHRPAVFA